MAKEARVLGVIPARAHSSRFPFKVLTLINQKPMIQHVWERASRAKTLDSLVIATDHPKVKEVAEQFGARVWMTPDTLNSGSDRVAFVAREHGAEILVNIQGDEPLLSPGSIDTLVSLLELDGSAGMATLAVKKEDLEGLHDRNVVKVVISKEFSGLYFSRSPIPCDAGGGYYKHLGIYAYRRAALLRFCDLPMGEYEKAERLEQLRALENGMRIKVGIVTDDALAVDRPEDIALVEARLKFLGES
jgi:3-deoxy-manno-octulosonate cytidylyltransferase (CMP-KDO synthetase)